MKFSGVKKISAAAIAAMMLVVGMTACGSSDSTGTADSGTANGTDVKKIGIIQLVEHDSLDMARKGFIDGLAEAGYVDGQNIKIDYKNAQGDIPNCTTIAGQFANDNKDLVLAVATQAAQSMASKTKDIPILVTAVTDPADSGLVESNEVPGGNVTGTSDLTPVKEQMQLLTQLCPDAKKVAMLYCTSEANSKFQIDLAKEEAAKYGIEAREKTVSDANDVQSVVQSLVGKVDAIYVPTDNVIASNMTLVAQIATSNNIPLFVGENNSVENGGLATYSVDYYELGKLTAKQAVRILENGETPANMPIEYLSENKLYINMDLAKQLGIEIPADLAEKAIDVKA